MSSNRIVYLSIRLMPYLVVSYFTLSSVFNQDVRGILYLSTLLLACAIASVIEQMLSYQRDQWFNDTSTTTQLSSPENLKYCGIMALQSKLSPLSVNLFTLIYTMCYILTPASYVSGGLGEAIKNNLPAFLFLLCVSMFEGYNAVSHSCFGPRVSDLFLATIVSVFFAGFFGWAFSSLIIRSANKKNMPKFLFTSAFTTAEVCSLAKTKLSCKS